MRTQDMGCLLVPQRAESLVLLPFVSWTRRQMSGKFVHQLSQLSLPGRRGMGDTSTSGQTFNLHASGPLGKDEGTRSYWESPFRGSGWPRACISDWLPAVRRPHSETTA